MKQNSVKSYYNLPKTVFGVFLVLMSAVACVCDDCKPIDDEPYINLHFFKKSNLGAASVAIREFNGRPGEEILYFQDTTSRFILPLSMWADSSLIILTYVSADNFDVEITDSIRISYDRIFETTPKNIVNMVLLNTQITEHSFDSLALVQCKDTLEICTSNESTLKAYF